MQKLFLARNSISRILYSLLLNKGQIYDAIHFDERRGRTQSYHGIAVCSSPPLLFRDIRGKSNIRRIRGLKLGATGSAWKFDRAPRGDSKSWIHFVSYSGATRKDRCFEPPGLALVTFLFSPLVLDFLIRRGHYRARWGFFLIRLKTHACV